MVNQDTFRKEAPTKTLGNLKLKVVKIGPQNIPKSMPSACNSQVKTRSTLLNHCSFPISSFVLDQTYSGSSRKIACDLICRLGVIRNLASKPPQGNFHPLPNLLTIHYEFANILEGSDIARGALGSDIARGARKPSNGVLFVLWKAGALWWDLSRRRGWSSKGKFHNKVRLRGERVLGGMTGID